MIARQFRPSGIQEFKSFLAACREAPETPVPRSLLEDDAHTEMVTPEVRVEDRSFVNRHDAAVYLRDVLAPLDDDALAANVGLWTWLSLYFFDQVCPPRGTQRVVRNDYFYVFEQVKSRNTYRHALFNPWYVLRIAPDHNRLLLHGTLSLLDRVNDEVVRRLYLTRIPCIFEVLDRVYWDEARGRARIGIVNTNAVKAGDLVHRFPIRIRQLEKTYDLFSLDANHLIELLGDEFRFGTSEKGARA